MEPTPDQPIDAYTWRVHPARQRVGQAVGALAIIVLMSLAVREAMAGTTIGPMMAIVGAVLLILALNRYFFPSRFTVDPAGITARYPLRTRRAAWDDLKRFDHDEAAGVLSTRARRSRFDAYTAVHVLFGDDHGEAIERINAYLRGGQTQ